VVTARYIRDILRHVRPVKGPVTDKTRRERVARGNVHCRGTEGVERIEVVKTSYDEREEKEDFKFFLMRYART